MQSSTRLARPPERAYPRFGFGLGPVHDHAWASRRDAVTRVRDLFDRRTPAAWTYETFQALVAVRDLFGNIRCENAFDWFTTCRLFGMPSGKLAGRFQKSLKRATDALRQGSATEFDRILDQLGGNAFGDMLDAYEAATRPVAPEFHDEPYGWVGLVWSSSKRHEVFVRTTAGRAKELTPASDDHDPFGLLAAWNVADVHVAREGLGELFHDTLELEPLRLRSHGSHLLEMKQQVEALLAKEYVLKLSPWHRLGPDPALGPFASPYAPLLEAEEGVLGRDVDKPSNEVDAAFATEVNGIFSAFGRR